MLEVCVLVNYSGNVPLPGDSCREVQIQNLTFIRFLVELCPLLSFRDPSVVLLNICDRSNPLC